MARRGTTTRRRLACTACVLLPILVWYINYVPLHLAAHTHLDSLSILAGVAESDLSVSQESEPHGDDHAPHPAGDHLAGYLTVMTVIDPMVLRWEQKRCYQVEAEGLIVQAISLQYGRGPPPLNTLRNPT